ncbi:MAG: DUF1631 family protein [Rhodoferax sp.]|uniref:DUF1631 family protein n=1 Tax=Rhodoferax sp. TaxID=50421 RepID=UPI001B6663B2|nr:DUF1631 family protein [Rhodoferax sp.]MBP9906637.1 DUF1631 family protein [Rhodoferax sp.]
MFDAVASGPQQSLYQSLLEQAAQAGRSLLLQAIAAALLSERLDLSGKSGSRPPQHRQQGAEFLTQHSAPMAERFVQLLQAQFMSRPASEPQGVEPSSRDLHLDQLGFMDEVQVQERVEIARTLHHMMRLVEMPLAEFNTYLSALLGYGHVVPERNVLRPESFVFALLQLMRELDVPASLRLVWLPPMAESLGVGLSALYRQWSSSLRRNGLRAVGFSAHRTPEVAGRDAMTMKAGRSRAGSRRVWTPAYRETVLTLDRLRQLMSGRPKGGVEEPAPGIASKFAPFDSARTSLEGPVQSTETSFESTVPAALDALQEMQQVDEMAQRMRHRPDFHADSTHNLALREQLIQQATTMNQVLSLEVVSLMLDQLVRDTRLLAPVRGVLERLEPALLRLVLVDPQFFMDRHHPARRLLHEVPQRGLAFCLADDPDFSVFLRSLQRHLGPLASASVQSREPFEIALAGLLGEWDDPAARTAIASQIDSAVAVLSYAEKRNDLAEQMATRLKGIPATQKVPTAVLDFLTGPWSVVMAEAELKDQSGADDPGGYKGLVSELLWSAQPELTRRDVDRLTKLVARLLSGLREGLRSIGYPSVKTSAFFDVLMKLHQQAFRSGGTLEASPPGLAASLLGNQDHWVGPAEAKVSGFMVFPDELPPKSVKASNAELFTGVVASAWGQTLEVGAWIELHTKGAPQRLQLSWVSPQSTMYLFTSARGKTQSMSRRLLERLASEGKLQVVSDRSTILDAALDEVVHSALLNSLDIQA